MYSASSGGFYSSDTHQSSKRALVGLGTQLLLLYNVTYIFVSKSTIPQQISLKVGLFWTTWFDKKDLRHYPVKQVKTIPRRLPHEMLMAARKIEKSHILC